MFAATAKEVIKSVNTVSAAYPPLQAALGLVQYIEESIELFKSNREDIKSIGTYSQRLSEQLSRAVDANKTENFVRVIQTIRVYIEKIAKKKGVVQYLHRRKIAQNLQGHRNSLWEEFVVFNITTGVDIQEAQREAESARKADELRAQEMLKKISDDLTTSAGVRDLAQDLGLAANEQSRKETMREIQDIHRQNDQDQETPTAAEAVVLSESIHLTQLILSPHYKWFRETFNSAKYSQSEVKNTLAESIGDIVRDLSDANLLAKGTLAEINHEGNALRQVSLLFRVLDARSRDAVLIRSFQRALSRVDGVEGMLKEGLVLQ